jgi:two-component system cell cycle sensor histidine kinase/response regulator CckA
MSLLIAKAILLVEDEPLLLKFLRTILERDGYSVLAAASPTQAIHIGQDPEVSIDLLLTAFSLMPISGAELAARLKRTRPELRVLIMSSDPAAPVLTRANGWAFVAKPFTSSDLLNTIENAFASDVAMPARSPQQSDELWNSRLSAGAGGHGIGSHRIN